jgi:hypothetical protein
MGGFAFVKERAKGATLESLGRRSESNRTVAKCRPGRLRAAHVDTPRASPWAVSGRTFGATTLSPSDAYTKCFGLNACQSKSTLFQLPSSNKLEESDSKMPIDEAFNKREHFYEEEYFRKREQEFIAAIRRREARQGEIRS